MHTIRTRLALLTHVTNKESLRCREHNVGALRRGPRAAKGTTQFPIHLTFTLDELLKTRLDTVSIRVGIARGTLIRDALECYLTQAENELKLTKSSRIPARVPGKEMPGD